MIATHLNAPYGKVISEQDVIDSLRGGNFLADNKVANAILSAIFLENSIDLILRCAREVNAPIESVNRLYKESINLTGHPCADWENYFNSNQK